MHVIGTDVVTEFIKKHPPARVPLNSWLIIARQATWRHLMDIRVNYPHADGNIKGIYTVFNIKGNSFRLITTINYKVKVVDVINVFTHAEYTKWSKS